MRWRWEAIEELLTNPVMGAEIGVKEGRFVQHMLKTYPHLTMYTVDPWEAQPKGNETYLDWDMGGIYQAYRRKVKPYRDRVIEIREYSETAAAKVPDGSLDFVFIDAQHDYESVKRDIELWAPKVKKGGLLSGHDYEPNFPGVIQAVKEYCKPETTFNNVWYLWT